MSNSTCQREYTGFIPALYSSISDPFCEVTGYNYSTVVACCPSNSTNIRQPSASIVTNSTTRQGCSYICRLEETEQIQFLRCMDGRTEMNGVSVQNANLAFCTPRVVLTARTASSAPKMRFNTSVMLLFIAILLLSVQRVNADCTGFAITENTRPLSTIYESLRISPSTQASLAVSIRINQLSVSPARSVSVFPSSISNPLEKMTVVVSDMTFTNSISIPPGYIFYGHASTLYVSFTPIYYLVDGHFTGCSDTSLEQRQNWTVLHSTSRGTEGTFIGVITG